MKAILPQLADISFQKLKRLKVPTLMLLGRQDSTTPSPIAAAWLDRLKAPKKATLWFEHSAHLPMIEEPGRFVAALLQHTRPLVGTEATRSQK